MNHNPFSGSIGPEISGDPTPSSSSSFGAGTLAMFRVVRVCPSVGSRFHFFHLFHPYFCCFCQKLRLCSITGRRGNFWAIQLQIGICACTCTLPSNPAVTQCTGFQLPLGVVLFRPPWPGTQKSACHSYVFCLCCHTYAHCHAAPCALQRPAMPYLDLRISAPKECPSCWRSEKMPGTLCLVWRCVKM